MMNGVQFFGGFYTPWQNMQESRKAHFKSKMNKGYGLFFRRL
jgi:hypothetical protein